MKIVRFVPPGKDSALFGIIKKNTVTAIVASPFEGMIVETSEAYDLDAVRLLAPCRPSKVVAVGLNYKDHAEELGMALPEEPLIFLKPPSSVIGPGEPIVCPPVSQQVEYEAELAVVMGKRAKDVIAEDALDYVLGYTCLNDVTARDLQKKDVQFTRSKSFDTFCPIGPCIETRLDPADAQVRSYLNGDLRQDSNTSQLVHPVDQLVEFISSIMTLEPGDVIATGTPFGVGQIVPGDEIVVEVEGVGQLKNPVSE